MSDQSELATALVAALTDLTVVEKDAHADLGTYGYDYATLPGLVKATRPTLAEHGIVALTPLHDHGNGLACSVVLLHSSGERMDFGPFPFPHGRDAQATGSMVTYHRRYALLAVLGMAAGDDDDGAKAVPAEPPTPVPGFRSSLVAATEKLNDAERELLRAWLSESGLPDRPSKMDAEQAGRTVEWILHMPKAGEAVPS